MSYASSPLSPAAQVGYLVTSEKKRLGWLVGGRAQVLGRDLRAGSRP